MDSINHLKDCLLPDNYEYKIIHFEKKQGNNCTLSFRIKNIKMEEDVKRWLKDYEEKSKFTWRVARTFKSSGRNNIFRHDYRCHHKTDPRRKNKKISKNTDCPATMKVVIKRYFDAPKLKKPDEDTKVFPCIVDLNSFHNHSSDSLSVLRFRDMKSTTREKLIHFFKTGHTATTARRALLTELLIENSDMYDTTSADSSLVPSQSVVQHLFNKTLAKLPVEKDLAKKVGLAGANVMVDLQNLVRTHCQTSGGKAVVEVVQSHIVVAMCTPIMERTVENLPQVNELVLVDASGNLDSVNHRVYFLSSPTVVGFVPIGCVLTDAEDGTLFEAGVQLLKTFFPHCFTGGPKVVVVDGEAKERKVLQDVWPDALVLQSQFHVLKTSWRWILDSKDVITKEDRASVYLLIRDLVHAETEEVLSRKWESLQFKIQHEKLQIYIKQLWGSRTLWSSCYRRSPPVNANNDSEALFRILKDIILNRVASHNLITLTDFILTKYELYLHHRYLDYSCDRYSKKLLKKFLIEDKKLVPKSDIKLDDERSISVVDAGKETHFVDVDNCFCSCCNGYSGQLCKHLASIVHYKNSKLGSKYWYSQSLKATMHKIATGREFEKVILTPLMYSPHAQTVEPAPSLSNLADHEAASGCSQVGGLDADRNTDGLDEIEKRFEEWYQNIRCGLRNNPEIYQPALKRMMLNSEKYASTETDLVSALNNFAKYEGGHN